MVLTAHRSIHVQLTSDLFTEVTAPSQFHIQPLGQDARCNTFLRFLFPLKAAFNVYPIKFHFYKSCWGEGKREKIGTTVITCPAHIISMILPKTNLTTLPNIANFRELAVPCNTSQGKFGCLQLKLSSVYLTNWTRKSLFM